ncbi:hypothetical protein BsWGS_15887 [Bradybaena similaris]
MELENSSDDVTLGDADNVLKARCLSPNAADRLTASKTAVAENGFACDQSVDAEDSRTSCENSQCDTTESLQRVHITAVSSSVDAKDGRHVVSECVTEKCSVAKEELASDSVLVPESDDHEAECDPHVPGETECDPVETECDPMETECDPMETECDPVETYDPMETEDGLEKASPQSQHETSSQDGCVAKSDVVEGSLDGPGENASPHETNSNDGCVAKSDVEEVDGPGENASPHETNSNDGCVAKSDVEEVDGPDENASPHSGTNSNDGCVAKSDVEEVDGPDENASPHETNSNDGCVAKSDVEEVDGPDENASPHSGTNSNDGCVAKSDVEELDGPDENASPHETNSNDGCVAKSDVEDVDGPDENASPHETNSNDGCVAKSDVEEVDGPDENASPHSGTNSQDDCVARSGVEGGCFDKTSDLEREKKPACDVQELGNDAPALDLDVICLDEDGESKDNDYSSKEEDEDCQNVIGVKEVSEKGDNICDEGNQSDVGTGYKIMGEAAGVTTTAISEDSVVYVDDESRQSESHTSSGRDHTGMDEEKENKETFKSSSDVKEVGGERKNGQKVELPGKATGKDNDKQSDSADDEVEIIGESKVVTINNPSKSLQTSQNIVFVPAGLPLLKQRTVAPKSGQPRPTFASSASQSPAMVRNFAPGSSSQRMPAQNPNFAVAGNIANQQKLQFMFSSVAPPKPQSSLDQIELIRWEIQNRINTRPKYFKPNPAAELGPLAKFLCDIGSDLIKEAVYHDLVKIQSKKKNQNKLNDKEKEDLGKLKEIEKDLYATIGHLKLKLRKKCSMCDFRTESVNIMFQHHQYPHEDSKCMRCSHCSFTAKQAISFKVHMETRHRIQPKLDDRKAAFECELCPYENNNEQKLNLHKQRCIKQFRPYFNLHPSCLSGAEINLCLENIFYKSVVPKNLQLVQQRHPHLPAMTDAQKQQAEIRSIAAQNTAAAIAAKKQLSQRGVPPTTGPRFNVSANGRMPVPVKMVPGQQQSVRYITAADTKGSRPTIANILNNQPKPLPVASIAPAPTPPPGAFEVCEICGGFVKDRKALRIHFFYAHRIDLPFNLFERNQAPLYCATCYVRFWTAQGLRKHIDSHREGNQSRGVVGKCILCSHHVLNLLLHMRLVHNRDMQHYLNLSMCMFCGVKSSSRQECENHMVSIHGQVDPISGTVKPSNAPVQPLKQQPQKVAAAEPKKAENNPVLKGCVCVLCNLRFTRNVDLTRHCMRMHHTCMKCGMVVVDKASLLKHICLLSAGGIRDCVVCGDTGYHPAYYLKHLRDKHLRKLSIRLTRLSKKTIDRWVKHPSPFTEPEEVLVEISDDDDDAEMQQKSSPAHSAENIPDDECVDKLENNEELADYNRHNDKNNLANKVAEYVEEEVIDVDNTRDDDDSRSSEIVQGQKRKSESPTSEVLSKKPKIL